MSAPNSSFEMDSLTDKTTPADDDTVLLKDSEASDELKELSMLDLKSFIVDQTAPTILLSTVNSDTDITPTDESVFFPISGSVTDGLNTAGKVSQTVPIDSTFRNFSVTIEQKAITTGASTVAFLVNSIIVDTIPIPNAAIPVETPLLITSGNTINVSAGDIVHHRVFIANTGSVKLSGISITVDVPISGGLATEFTWGASDEDSPLITGILYTTEASNVTKPISQVILTLKNSPTNNPIQVNIIQEDGPNSNSFPVENTIFSTEPQIKDFEFTSLGGDVPGAIAGGTFSWAEGNRLQILLTTNDNNNFAATGLKVSLL